jgi:hypothetical protein
MFRVEADTLNASRLQASVRNRDRQGADSTLTDQHGVIGRGIVQTLKFFSC